MISHQHFNLGHDRALLLSSIPSIYLHLGLGGIEQIDEAPEYLDESR